MFDLRCCANMFLDGLLSRNARTFIVLSGMVLLLQRLCERFELPPWCGWVASVVFGGLYHTAVMQINMVGKRAAPLGKDLEWIQGAWTGKIGNGSTSLVLIFSTRGLGKAFEKVEALHKEWSAAGVQFVAISRESKDTVEAFVRSKKFTFPVAADPSADDKESTYAKYPVARLPTVFLCRSDGVIGWHGHPLDGALESNLARAVQGAKKDLAAKAKAHAAPKLSGKKAKSMRHRK